MCALFSLFFFLFMYLVYDFNNKYIKMHRQLILCQKGIAYDLSNNTNVVFSYADYFHNIIGLL